MSQCILIIDDAATMRMLIKQTLEIANYRVEMAEDGLQGLALLKGGLKPDLIITDINMPNMGGIEFIRNARPLLRFTPILTLTTESQATLRNEAKAAGATGWLVKPVAGPDLLKVIKQVLPAA